MDAKLTLKFDKDVIDGAKDFTQRNGLSMSRLIEHLLRRATSAKHMAIEEYPIADWVMELMEGPVEYNPRTLTKKELREEHYEGRARQKAAK